MPMFFWSLVTGFFVTVAYLIPILGQMMLITAMPLLTFMSLCACRHIEAGQPMRLAMWMEPLHDKDTRKRLIRLGLAYMICCLLGGFLATLPFMDSIMAAVGDGTKINEAALMLAIRGPFIVFAFLYIIISALFWHAPALIGWHKIKLKQALFFSMVACWRNKWPFLVYGLSWGAVFLSIQLLGNLMVELGMTDSVAQVLLTPVNIVVAALVYCSFYPTYISVFGANYPTLDEAR